MPTIALPATISPVRRSWRISPFESTAHRPALFFALTPGPTSEAVKTGPAPAPSGSDMEVNFDHVALVGAPPISDAKPPVRTRRAGAAAGPHHIPLLFFAVIP